MNIVKLQNDLKDLSDQQLYQTMQGGAAPQYLVLGEMQRRKKMREEAGSQPQPETSVAEEIMAPPQQQGIAAMPQAPMMGMNSGGIVGFAKGGITAYQKGAAQAGAADACYKNPITGKQECPPAKPDVRKANTSKTKLKKMADGGIVGEDFQRLSEILKGYESSKSHTDMLGRVKKSKAGALGMMQVMPVTAAQPGSISPSIFKLAKSMGVPFDEAAAAKKVDRDGSPYPAPEAQAEAARLLAMPELNIQFGDMYLQGLTKRYDGDVEAAAIAYNAGMGNADKWLRSGRDYAVLPRRGETEPYATGISKDYAADSEHAEVMRQLAAIDAKEEAMNRPSDGIMQVLPNEPRRKPVPLASTVDRSGEIIEESEAAESEDKGGLAGLLGSIGDFFMGSKSAEAAPVEDRNPPPSNEDWVDPDTGYSLRDLKDYFDEQKILNDLNKEVNYEPLASFKEGKEVKKDDEKSFYEWLTALANSGGMTEAGVPSEAVAPVTETPFNSELPTNVQGQRLSYTDDPSLDFTEPPAGAYNYDPDAPGEDMNVNPYMPPAETNSSYPFPTTDPDRDPAFVRKSPRLEAAKKAQAEKDKVQAEIDKVTSQIPADKVDPFATQAQNDEIRAQAQADSEAAAQQRVDDASTFAEKRDAKKKQEGVAAYYEQQKDKEDKASEEAKKKATETQAKTGAKVSGFRKDDVKSEGITGLRSDAEYFADLRKRMEEAKDPNKLNKAMIAAGLGMAASGKQDFLGMAAEGGLAGMKQYTQAVKDEKQEILDLLKEEGDIRTASAANEYKNYALMLKNQIEGEKQWTKKAESEKVRLIGELAGKLRRQPTQEELAAAMQQAYVQHMAKYAGGLSTPAMPISRESVTLATD